MFAKINQYFITRYPLLWNLRLVYILPAAIIIHVLFYLSGLAQANMIELRHLHLGSYFRIEHVVVFSCLVTALLIIGWLVFYLRNNPVKSLYSLKRGYMFAEFFMVFLVFFSSSTFFLTYKQGLYDGVERNTAEIDLVKEGNALNLAYNFVPVNDHDFRRCGSCDTLLARIKNRPGPEEEEIEKLGYEAQHYYDDCYNDSFPRNYLFYCSEDFTPFEKHAMDKYERHQIAKSWLEGGKKDSILQLLNYVWTLCDTYGGVYNFTPEVAAEACFADSQFYITRYFNLSEGYDYHADYVQLTVVKEALDRIDTVRDGFWSPFHWIALLYTSLGMAILLISFRTTRLKHWFMALIGAGIWAIIIALIMVNLIGYQDEDEAFPFILLILFLCFLAYAVGAIRDRGSKMATGIVLNWVYWLLPAVLPLLWGLLIQMTHQTCPPHLSEHSALCQTPFHLYLRYNWTLMNTVNLIAMFPVFGFFILPLAKKWQSNPEE